MDSTVGFMSKISAFCSAISQLSSNSIDDLPPPYPSANGQLLRNMGNGLPTVLSKPQVAHILEIYWMRFHDFVPILSRSRVNELFEPLWAADGTETQSVPLIDGVIALCLKYMDSSGLNRRLLGLRWDQGDPSLAYFGRCVAATGRLAAFAEPSLDCVQCYVLMTLYLLDAGEHQSAYNMIGLALRIAQALNLHHGLPGSDPGVQLAGRVWWTIIQLNFRCARLLGRPVGVQLAETTCPIPLTDEFTYHTRTLTLTRATLAVTEALSRHPSCPHDDHAAQAEPRASALSAEVRILLEWRDQELRPIIRRPLHVDNKEAFEWFHLAAESSSSQVLYNVLLELQYYDEIIGLHRPFICFPNGLLNSQHIPHADAHATTSLNHAIATVNLTHRIMSMTDMLYGRSEVHQWLWNALLTLIGFLMAYPFCIYAPTARHHAQLALEIFSGADPRNVVAVRAADITRTLCSKVDSLVQILKSSGARVSSPTVDRQDIPRSNDSSAPSYPSSDALWSWAEMTNPDEWSAYSNEIAGVLADFPDLPFDNDGFFPLP
ncbi:hypothetical protein F5Y13DRAFT_195576 [Hypoxylon sp. FL1857]|nr:hypothetical protein F5Y13DRAFT_195576 [Hypoxylon sp. FL1857]